MVKRIFLVFLALALLFPLGCQSASSPETKDKPVAELKSITMKKILAANHPDARLKKAENVRLERDDEYSLFFDKNGNVLETIPAEETFRLTVDLSKQIIQMGDTLKEDGLPYASPEEEWYPYLLFFSVFSYQEKITAKEEKDGLYVVTTRLGGENYDIGLNREETVTDFCEIEYTLNKKDLTILSYVATVKSLDGETSIFTAVIREGVEEPFEIGELKDHENGGIAEAPDEDPEEPEEPEEPDSSGSSGSSGLSGSTGSAGSSGSSGSSGSAGSSGSSSNKEWFYQNDNQLNLLLIGNSYSTYWTTELWGLLDAAGYKNVSVCNVYYSGCTFEQHWTWYETNQSNYKFYVSDNATARKEYTGKSLSFALEYKNWDAFSLQQSNKWAGSRDKFINATSPYLPKIEGLLRDEFPNARIFWQQNWSHELGEGSYQSPNTLENVRRVYLEVGLEYCNSYNFTLVPLGEAWPLVRHDPLFYQVEAPANKNTPTKSLHTRVQHAGALKGEIINTDLSHDGDIGGGQYLNACVWFETLTGKSVVGNSFRPEYPYKNTVLKLTEEQIKALQNAAHTAMETSRKLGYIK